MKLAILCLLSLFAFSAVAAPEPNLDLCPECISFVSQSLEELEQIIANAGVIGSCGALCSLLHNKLEATVCNLVCDYVGIEAFIDVLTKLDPDPFLICEEFKLCTPHDGGRASLHSLIVVPSKGPQGTTFQIAANFNVTAATGPGEAIVEIIPPDGMPFGNGEVYEVLTPGDYNFKWGVQANPSEQEEFSPGIYKVGVALCYGECGSKHKHSAVLCEGESQFEITE